MNLRLQLQYSVEMCTNDCGTIEKGGVGRGIMSNVDWIVLKLFARRGRKNMQQQKKHYDKKINKHKQTKRKKMLSTVVVNTPNLLSELKYIYWHNLKCTILI